MDFGSNFKFYGEFDVEPIVKELDALSEEAWDDSVGREYDVHRHARNVFLINNLRPEHLYGRQHDLLPRFQPLLDPVIETLREQIPESNVIRIQFSRHHAGYGFGTHDDASFFTLTHSHRLHFVIRSNPGVYFEVDGERRHLPVGQVWDINNVRLHSGGNEGTTDRIHCIIGFGVPIRSNFDRMRYLINVEMRSGNSGMLLARPKLSAEDESISPLEAQTLLSQTKQPDVVGSGAIVEMQYLLRDAKTGQELCTNTNDEPTAFAHGLGQLPHAVERHLEGLAVGETKTFQTKCEEAYGLEQADLRVRVSAKAQLRGLRDEPLAFARAGKFWMGFGIDSAKDGSVVLDANHEFAGRDLEWEVSIHSIRQASNTESTFSCLTGPTIDYGARHKAYFEYLKVHDTLEPDTPIFVPDMLNRLPMERSYR